MQYIVLISGIYVISRQEGLMFQDIRLELFNIVILREGISGKFIPHKTSSTDNQIISEISCVIQWAVEQKYNRQDEVMNEITAVMDKFT